MRRVLIRIVKGIGIVVAVLLWLVAGLLLYIRYISPLIDAASRPATSAEMNGIATAVVSQSMPDVGFGRGNVYFAVAIDGRDPPPTLLPRLSFGRFIALPGGAVHPTIATVPKGWQYLVTVKAFRVTPFGTASGTVFSWCGNICANSWHFDLIRLGEHWVVVRRKQSDWIS